MKSLSCENLLYKKIDDNQLSLPQISLNVNLKQPTLPKNKINKDTFYKKTIIIDELSKKRKLQKSFLMTSLNVSKLNSRNRNDVKMTKKKANEMIDKIKVNSTNLNNNKTTLKKNLSMTFLSNQNLKLNYKFNNKNISNISSHISGLINRKEINNIPICPNLLITYKNKYANYSEYNRFMKFNEELLKLRAQINLDSKNSFKYLKEFMRYYGIKNECYYKNNFLCNFNNFVKSNFVNIINPNFSLQKNLINALLKGGVVNTGLKEEEKVFISPFIKEEKEPKKFVKITNNIKKKVETMCIVSLEKQQKLNKRLD